MRVHPISLAAAAAVLLYAYPALAESINVDELPHNIIDLPNGQRAEVVRFNGVNYRVVDPEILRGANDTDPDVCFEAKFDSIMKPDQVKLFGAAGTLIVENPEVLHAASAFKRADNVWFCGSLRKDKDGKALEFMVTDMQKQLPDMERYNKRIARIEAELRKPMSREDRLVKSERAIDEGRRIELDMKQAQNNFGEFDRLGAMRDKAYDVGLESKEQALKPDDADGFFELAEQWKEYRHNLRKHRELVLRCLKLDPDHPRASRLAEEQFQMVKFEGNWIRKEQMEEILKSKREDQVKLDAANKAKAEAFKRDQERAKLDRPALLARLQLGLCTNDPKRREGALETLGKTLGESLDPEFGVAAVSIISDLQDHAVIFPALDQASKSQWADVRRQTYEALAWRSGIKEDQDMALKVFATALKAEKDIPTARAGVDAMVATGRKPALGALVASLTTSELPVRDEIMAGLKNATKQALSSKEEWESWWQSAK